MNSLNITLDSAISFTYFSSLDQLNFGGLANGTSVVLINPQSNDFALAISQVSTLAPSFLSATYCQVDTAFNCFAHGSTLNGSVSLAVVSVSEPGTLPLMALGIAALLCLRFRRRWSHTGLGLVAWFVVPFSNAPTRGVPNFANA